MAKVDCNLIQESSSLEPGDIRDAMHKVFNEILLRGILPAFGQQISRTASKLGIFESQNCLKCLQASLRAVPEFESLSDDLVLCEILPMCTGQNFFQTLCTRMVEYELLRMVWFTYRE